MKLGIRRILSITVVPVLAALGLVLGAGPAHALTVQQCLSSAQGLNQETVMWTWSSSFMLKCGRKDPSGFGLKHINEAHPYTSDLYACMSDVLQYGLDSPANSPNRKRVLEVSGFSATVIYLPGSPPSRNSIVTAYTNGSPTNQWTLCKNLV